MSLQDPKRKMSKSDPSELSYILLTDSDDATREKVGRAVTDSEAEIKSGADKPALSNLLTIFALCADTPISELEQKYTAKGYAEFKSDLAEAVIARVAPLREKIRDYSEEDLDRILGEGAERARKLAQAKMIQVKKAVGLWR